MRRRGMEGAVQAARAVVNKYIILTLQNSGATKILKNNIVSPESLDTLCSPAGMDSLLTEVCTLLTLFTVWWF